MILSQGGEFGLVLVMLAASEGVIESTTEQVVLATIILSIALTPLFVGWAGNISRKVCFRNAEIHNEAISHKE